jgi:hypothetical protein
VGDEFRRRVRHDEAVLGEYLVTLAPDRDLCGLGFLAVMMVVVVRVVTIAVAAKKQKHGGACSQQARLR